MISKIALFFLFLFTQALSVGAHSFSITSVTTHLQIESDQIKMETTVPLPYNVSSDITKEEKMKIDESTTEYLSENLYILQQEEPCQLQTISSYPKEDAPLSTVLQSIFVCGKTIGSMSELTIKSTLFQELSTASWNHFIFLKDKEADKDIILNRQTNVYPNTAEAQELAQNWGKNGTIENTHSIEDNAEELINGDGSDTSNLTNTKTEQGPESNNYLSIIQEFIIVGIEHILIGTDHILFVIVLVLLIVSVKDILKITLTFTIAHSITLILASLSLIQLTGKIVEPIIALSIIYIAIENFLHLRKKEKKKSALNKRLVITFLFGLFHGLGFAGVLSEIHIPEEYFLTSLLSFNIGIEIGQLLIVFIILLPLLYLMKKYSWRNIALQIVSILISIVAAFWFIERVFL